MFTMEKLVALLSVFSYCVEGAIGDMIVSTIMLTNMLIIKPCD